jgi:uncharacterized membrane protein
MGAIEGKNRGEQRGAVMALSDYERRMLDEIAAELASLREPRLVRFRAAISALRWTIVAVVVAAGGVVAASFTVGWLAAPLGAISGALAGFALSSKWLRRRGRSGDR